MNWLEKEGIEFLKKVGIRSDFKVLDFGCNEGDYTIPASIITKDKGSVIAIDIDKSSFEVIKSYSNNIGLNNIIYLLNDKNNFDLNIQDYSVDFVMAYDVLHYFELSKRTELYNEFTRVLKSGGIFSVFPKHTKNDSPNNNLANITTNVLIKEIANSGFTLSKKVCGKLNHYGNIEHNCVYNFIN
ncbi:methyltransferase domain-containing protein [bacterium]|nr:methyltransferase domain-containing protein [bacterium]